jgi:hypothetical protein
LNDRNFLLRRLSFLGRIGGLASDFPGSRRFGRGGGFCGARGCLGKSDSWPIAISELDTGGF